MARRLIMIRTFVLTSLALGVQAFQLPPSILKPAPHQSLKPRLQALSVFKLYGNQGTRSPLVNWYLEEIGAPFEMVDAAAADRAAYPAYPNPFGSIPAASFEPDGSSEAKLCLFESGAILQFLADKYGGLDTPEQRAEAGKWVMWANASLDPICFVENDRGQVIDTKLKGAPKAMAVLEGLLAETPWLLGEAFSVADVAVGSYLLYALLFFPQLRFGPKWPNISRYAHACATRPAYAKAFGEGVAATLAERAIAGGEEEPKKMFGVF